MTRKGAPMIDRLKWVLAVFTIVLFAIAIVGMFADSSPRWVEPVQEAGWIFLILLIVVDYLLDRGPEYKGAAYSTPEKVAWGFAAAAIACMLVAIIGSVASETRGYWVEAFEAAGILCNLGLILIVVTRQRGRIKKESGPAKP
jgi:purine-cytosine permease-like protein